MPLVRIGDVRLQVAVAGQGEPLVLLHGFTGSAAQWGLQILAFAEHFRTVAVDLLGHGGSDAPADPGRYRMERCVSDLAALLDAVDVRHARWLGYSMGARVALAWALTYPERVDALVLEGVSPGIEDSEERRQRARHDEALAEQIEHDGVEAFVDAWMRQPLFASQARLGPEILAMARAARCANSAVGLSNSLRGMGTGAQASLWPRLPALDVPTLLAVGAEDTKFRGIAENMVRRMRRATLAIVPAAGHAAHIENPSAFNARVLEFLRDKRCVRVREKQPPVETNGSRMSPFTSPIMTHEEE
ncbi:MAG: 2-succinyl-6-hydroxy-2,4-cyclohexadiene-1-carboxylate synthase [Candidatus Binatia bacterium]